MEALVAIVLLGGAGYVFYVWQANNAREQAAAQAAGRLMHLRGAAFPTTCSWCKNTGVAHKLMVFEKTDERWRPFDVRGGLAAVPDDVVEGVVAAMFQQATPRWRRFCTEKCTREFFAAEHVDAIAAFGPCSYCSARFPMALLHCPNCAAVRSA